MSKFFLILLMLFCHIVDDYYLQGWLASAKQKKWWVENSPQSLYKHDYIMALAMHSMSWSFMIMLPVSAFYKFNVGFEYLAVFIINAIIHGLTDNAKANLYKINLIQDQTIHILQIVITAILMVR